MMMVMVGLLAAFFAPQCFYAWQLASAYRIADGPSCPDFWAAAVLAVIFAHVFFSGFALGCAVFARYASGCFAPRLSPRFVFFALRAPFGALFSCLGFLPFLALSVIAQLAFAVKPVLHARAFVELIKRLDFKARFALLGVHESNCMPLT